MLSFDPDRSSEGWDPVVPKDAATLLVLRDGTAGLEVFCVRRHAASAFMGGAVVFPGGKLDEADRAEAFAARGTGLHLRAAHFADDPTHARALAVCACRESLEEAMILPSVPAIPTERLEPMRAALEAGETLLPLLEAAGSELDTGALVPFARWITPAAEQRRYDARFFLTSLPDGQEGLHDDRETVHSVWASPRRMLEAFAAGDVLLAPPTTRCLELLAPRDDVEAALRLAAAQSLEPICPELVGGDELVLALPGDPDHSVADRRVAGPTRFVLEDGRLVSADP